MSFSFNPSRLRRHILTMAYMGQSAHIGCAFSLVEICSVLYSSFLRFDPNAPHSPERDYLILSKGHGVMALYACFREIGWIADSELESYLKDGTRLRGLCEANIPGCEVTSGSLGHGLSIAAGVAFGLKRLGSDRRVFCIVGDGEMNEGSMWEAMLFAAHHRLDNLLVIVDANNLQAMGPTTEVLGLEPLLAKFKTFGFSAMECDGHDLSDITSAISHLHRCRQQPTALIARTTKGYGVSFMANNNLWHYSRLSRDAYDRALAELS